MTDLREKALRLASTLPKGSDARRSLLTILNREAGKKEGNKILEKMGGSLHLETMLGLTDFAYLPNGVEFGWPNRDRDRGNFVRVARHGDTYSMTFEALSTRGRRAVAQHTGVAAEDLADVFEKQTGWVLRLGSRKTSRNFEHEMRDYYGERKLAPTSKDYKRVTDLWNKAKWDENKAEAMARRMARAITHPDKAYRRYAAAEDENFHAFAYIFHGRAQELWRAGER